MATQLSTTKLVAQHLNERWDNIDTVTDGILAKEVNLVFDDELEMLLKEYPWSFSMRWRELEAISNPTLPPEWVSALPYPTTARKVWKVMNPSGITLPSIPFEVGYLENGRKVIFQNVGDAHVKFSTTGVTIEDADEIFVKALSYILAARVCFRVTGSDSLKKTLKAEAALAVTEAMENSAIETNEPTRDRDPDWLTARG